MAHDHDHHHGDANTYYLEQIFTIGACAALAFATCMWWWKSVQTNTEQGAQGLTLFIHPRYHLLVLGGGIGLLALVVIRAIAVWVSVDKAADARVHEHGHEHEHSHEHSHKHEHQHEHGESCDHGHHHHDHDHGHDHGKTASTVSAVTPAVHDHAHHHHDHGHDDHGHEHGWAPWRYVVLLLPVVLYFLNLPNSVFTSDKDISKGVSGPSQEVADKGEASLSFKQLEMAALSPEGREQNSGKTIRLVGKFVGDDEKRFSLTRYKINCCAADAVPLNAVILVDPKSKEKLKPRELRNKWVEVKGQVQFLSRPAQNDPSRKEYLPAIIVYPKPDKPLKELVKVVPPDPNPYVD